MLTGKLRALSSYIRKKKPPINNLSLISRTWEEISINRKQEEGHSKENNRFKFSWKQENTTKINEERVVF